MNRVDLLKCLPPPPYGWYLNGWLWRLADRQCQSGTETPVLIQLWFMLSSLPTLHQAIHCILHHNQSPRSGQAGPVFFCLSHRIYLAMQFVEPFCETVSMIPDLSSVNYWSQTITKYCTSLLVLSKAHNKKHC